MSQTVYGMCIGVLLLCAGCAAVAADSKPEDGTIFSGRLTIYAVDNFKDRISQTRYVLKLDSSGKTVSLNFSAATDISELRSGMQVEVLGRPKNGYIDVAHFDIVAVPSK